MQTFLYHATNAFIAYMLLYFAFYGSAPGPTRSLLQFLFAPFSWLEMNFCCGMYAPEVPKFSYHIKAKLVLLDGSIDIVDPFEHMTRERHLGKSLSIRIRNLMGFVQDNNVQAAEGFCRHIARLRPNVQKVVVILQYSHTVPLRNRISLIEERELWHWRPAP